MKGNFGGLNRKVLFVVLISLLLVGLATATVINYVSNILSAQVTVHPNCSDGIDNDGDSFIDLADLDCLNDCNIEDGDNILNGNCV